MAGKHMNSEIGRSSVTEKVKMKLWGVSGCRCELCNRLLYSDLFFGVDGNYSELAHIHAVSEGGPRHKIGMTTEEKNDIENLMLLCEEHHHLIDSEPSNFGDGLLIKLKKKHEDRIRIATDISENQSCRMVSYFSNIDDQEVFYSERLFRGAVLSAGLMPLQQPVIPLHGDSRVKYEPTKESFLEKEKDLEVQFRSWFNDIVKSEDAIAVFALAPQPLLFKLGTLINDQYNAQIFQCHRSDHKWAWKHDSSNVEFRLEQTRRGNRGKIALVLDLSEKIVDDRIVRVLGDECSITHLTIDNPNRSFVLNKSIQDAFVVSFRQAMEKIKNHRPAPSEVHMFMSMPNSLSIRAGMDYMPKADLPAILYEQVTAEQGFFDTITIGG